MSDWDKRDTEPVRQPHFDFLPEKMSGRVVTKEGAVVSGFEFEAEWRKHIGLGEGRDATMR